MLRCRRTEEVTSSIMEVEAVMTAHEAARLASRCRYLLMPPPPELMRHSVRGKPELVQRGLVFLPMSSGETLSDAEAAEWGRRIESCKRTNAARLQHYLTGRLRELAKQKATIKMRVHFGTTALTQSLDAFKNRDIGYDNFVRMMDASRVRNWFNR